MPNIVTYQATLHYRDAGEGFPFLFLHGHPDTHTMWDGVIDDLQDTFRCIAPDLPGYGKTIVPQDVDLTRDGRARFVDTIVNESGIEGDVFVVMHDHGGPFGLAWAIENPDRVAGLCIVNSLYQSDYEWHRMARIWQTPVLGDIVKSLEGITPLARALYRYGMRGRSKGVPVRYIDEVVDNMTSLSRHMSLRLYRETNLAELGDDWDSRINSLIDSVPTLVLWGEKDPFLPVSLAHDMEDHGADLYSFPDYGHWLAVEAPEVVSRYLRDFFKDVPPRTRGELNG